MDTNLDQVITLPELDVAMKSAGIEGGPRVMELMKQLDLDGDGALDMEEFLAATTEMQLVYYQNRIWWAFQQYDVNKDGMITVEEVEKVSGRSQYCRCLALHPLPSISFDCD